MGQMKHVERTFIPHSGIQCWEVQLYSWCGPVISQSLVSLTSSWGLIWFAGLRLVSPNTEYIKEGRWIPHLEGRCCFPVKVKDSLVIESPTWQI